MTLGTALRTYFVAPPNGRETPLSEFTPFYKSLTDADKKDACEFLTGYFGEPVTLASK